LFLSALDCLFLAFPDGASAKFLNSIVLAEYERLVGKDSAVADSVALKEFVYDSEFAAGSDVAVEIFPEVPWVFFEGKSLVCRKEDACGNEAVYYCGLRWPHACDLGGGSELLSPLALFSIGVELVSRFDQVGIACKDL